MNRKQAAWYALAVLFAINALNFFDRTIIGAVGEPIRKEFGLGDSGLGALTTAFTILYAFVGLPFGRFADKYSRGKMLAVGVFFWSLLTAATGLARSFWQIFALRLGVGIGEATCAPAAASLIGDLFPSEKRGKAMAVFMLGLPVGIALSFAVSGAVAKDYGWRTAFLIAGLPGIVCALAALLIREPERGATEKIAVGTRRRAGAAYKIILSIPTMRWLILSGAIHNFSLYALSAFITPYLMRFHRLDIENANYVSTIIYGLLSLPGLLGGGFVGDAANRKKPNGALLVLSGAILLSIPFFIFALGVAAGNVTAFLFLIGASVALMYFYYSIVYAAIADVTEPALRGSAMAVYFMAMYVLGASLGPFVVGLISDYFTQQAAQTAGILIFNKETLEPFRGAGLRSAMYLVPVLSGVLTFVLLAAARAIKSDVGKMRNWMKENNERE